MSIIWTKPVGKREGDNKYAISINYSADKHGKHALAITFYKKAVDMYNLKKGMRIRFGYDKQKKKMYLQQREEGGILSAQNKNGKTLTVSITESLDFCENVCPGKKRKYFMLDQISTADNVLILDENRNKNIKWT